MTKRSSTTLLIPDVVQAFLDELDAERQAKVREKARQLREWDDEFFNSIRTNLAPTENPIGPAAPAEGKVTTSSPVQPAKASASPGSEVKYETLHKQITKNSEPSYDYVQNHKAALEAPIDNVHNHTDDSWFSAENLHCMATELAQCPDREVLDTLRECWPAEPMKAASRLLSPEESQRIKGWVIKSNALAEKRKLWELEAPIPTDLGYGIASDSTPKHTLRKPELLTRPQAPAGRGVSPAYQLVTNAQSLAEYLKPLAAAKVIGLDTETTGLDPHQHKIRLIQIAAPDQPVVIVDLAALAPDALDPLRQLLTNSAIKIFHNGKFDWKFLVKAGLTPTGPYFDTMLASQLLTAGLPGKHSLKAIAAEYLEIELDKDQQSSDWSGEVSPTQLEYAARDAALLLQLRKVIKPKLVEAGLVEAAKLEFAALPAVAEMELHGMLLDLSKWEVLGREMEQAKAKAKAELGQQLRSGNPQTSLLAEFDTVDPDSPSQILAAMRAMGIPVESTGKDALIPLAGKYPVIKTLLEYRRFAKAVSSFTEKFPAHINPVTGRIHPNYNQYGAATGRFSASNPNLQQVPRGKEVRSCFIPKPGYKLVIADYSQIELRVAAEISGDRTMIEAYQNGEDLHKLTASLITGKPLDEISKSERQAGKPVNFGLIYGCGAKKLGQTAENDYGVVKPLKEWEAYRTQFFKAYRGIANWHSRLQRDRPIEIRTLSNRRRQWTEQPWVTATSNSMVQGTAADITKIALGILPDALARTGAKLIGTIHDEILLECPEATANVAARIMQDCMVSAGETYLKLVPVEVEAKVADSWADK